MTPLVYSSLRVAELVWREGVLIKEFPPEAYVIKNLDDALAFLKTDDGQKRYSQRTYSSVGAWPQNKNSLYRS